MAKNKQQPVGSLINHFNQILTILYAVALAISIPSLYFLNSWLVEQEVTKELRLLGDTADSMQAFISEELTPFMLDNERVPLAAISSTMATHNVMARVFAKREQYRYQVVSDHPLNPKNKAKGYEIDLLATLRADLKLSELTTREQIGDDTFLILARPVMARESCIACHGGGRTTVEQVKSVYKNSYSFIPGKIEGVSLVAMPVTTLHRQVIERTMWVIGILTITFFILFARLNITVRRYFIDPVIQITRAARAVSKGDVDREIIHSRDDEIGRLAKSVELLRRSLVSVMRRAK